MSMDIPLVDLPGMHAPIMDHIKTAIDQVISDHAFVLGPAVEHFEEEFARFVGVPHCVGLNSGTSALHLALLCAGVKAGDDVITTPASWISTSWAISYIGARPVYVDIDPQTYGMDPQRLERAITRRTTAILPVHLYGHPADMQSICQCAARHGLPVVEDAAQAHGASCGGQRCGSIGDIAAFSFYPGKNLGAFGEAGAVTTRHAEWAQRACVLRDHAQAARHHHVELGFNYRMEGIQAAVLGAKLAHLEHWNDCRRRCAARYAAELADVPGVVLPQAAAWAEPVWHIYAVRTADRERFREHLRSAGIATGVHYPTPIHLQPAYAHLGYGPKRFPVAEQLSREQVSLPMFPGLEHQQVRRVAQAMREFECSAAHA